MGWDFTRGASRADVIAEATETWQAEGRRCELLRKTEQGGVVYSVHRYTDKDTDVTLAMVTLVEKQSGCWGTKRMSEETGPYYFDFPVAWLDMLSPPPNEWSRTWREKVRARHAGRKGVA